MTPIEILSEGLEITENHISKSKDLRARKDTFRPCSDLKPIAIAMKEKGVKEVRSYFGFIGFWGDYPYIECSDELREWNEKFHDYWDAEPIKIKLVNDEVCII